MQMLLGSYLGLPVILAICLFGGWSNSEDLPCQARDVGIEGRSVVCVCNATYCDTISREDPEPGTYVVYTSSASGKRFEKSFGTIVDESATDPDDEVEEDTENDSYWDRATLRLFVNTRYQYIEGFGGSVTDAASINWRKLSDAAQVNFINTYFSSEGIEYNMIRVPIAGADFSTHPYTYNEYPWYDTELTNYTLTSEDLFYKLPMIKRCMNAATSEVRITASTWSPPIWMKTNERITGFGQLRPEYYQTYADYHLRFIQEYEKADVKIWAITTSNEPINGIVPWAPFNSIGWFPSQMARWIVDNLGPTIRNSKYNDTKIFAIDDQRYLLHVYAIGMELEDKRAFDYIDGFAIHYYGNFAPAYILTLLQRRYPNMMLLSTEACEGPMPWDANKVEIGSWNRAKKYARYIIQDLRNYVTGWIDWNLALDENGGPNWADNFVDAPILILPENDEFIKQPMFYAMGHFSKFIPRGSRRILSARRSHLRVGNVAFLKPDGNIVMVLQNERDRDINVRIRVDANRVITFPMEANSIKTMEINHN